MADIWQRVQEQLLNNRPPDAVHGSSSEVNLLASLLFDAEGSCFTPLHTTKKGRRYRYYVCQAKDAPAQRLLQSKRDLLTSWLTNQST